MLSECFYKYLICLKHQRPEIKFIIVGDFEQLAPVCDRINESIEVGQNKRKFTEYFDYKNSGALFELCDSNRIELTTCRRADHELYNLCLNVEDLDVSKFSSKSTKVNLSFTNKKRMEVNKHYMDENEKEKANKTKALIIPKHKYDPNSQEMKLFVNTPLIARKTSKNLNIMNNQMGKITKINTQAKEITVKMDDLADVLLIKFDEFNLLFYVAYCLTIFKCQGETYNHNYTIHQWSMLNSREKYVALSRGTKKRFINIIN